MPSNNETSLLLIPVPDPEPLRDEAALKSEL